MANFKAFHWNFSSIINIFLKSPLVLLVCVEVQSMIEMKEKSDVTHRIFLDGTFIASLSTPHITEVNIRAVELQYVLPG